MRAQHTLYSDFWTVTGHRKHAPKAERPRCSAANLSFWHRTNSPSNWHCAIRAYEALYGAAVHAFLRRRDRQDPASVRKTVVSACDACPPALSPFGSAPILGGTKLRTAARAAIRQGLLRSERGRNLMIPAGLRNLEGSVCARRRRERVSPRWGRTNGAEGDSSPPKEQPHELVYTSL